MTALPALPFRAFEMSRCLGLNVAKIAVSGVPFRLDRPYDYSIPPALEGKVAPGVRVEVPFGRGEPALGGHSPGHRRGQRLRQAQARDIRAGRGAAAGLADALPRHVDARALLLHGLRGREGRPPGRLLVQGREDAPERQVRHDSLPRRAGRGGGRGRGAQARQGPAAERDIEDALRRRPGRAARPPRVLRREEAEPRLAREPGLHNP